MGKLGTESGSGGGGESVSELDNLLVISTVW
jgi:hypothetical protein